MFDPRGNPVSTASPDAVAASEQALWRTMSFYGTPFDDLDAASAADPGWLLPQVMKAGFLLSLTEPGLVADARALLDAAEPLAAHANAREREHLRALRVLLAGDWHGAVGVWQALLEAHPRDAFALQLAHLFDFYRGDASGLRRRAERALPAWDASDPLRPYVLGHLAFGLEEGARYGEAEAAGREALAGAAKVPWAIHAVAHVMEMQARHEEGAAWMQRWKPDWAIGNGFVGHLGWHHSLFMLEAMDVPGALAAFDEHLRADPAQITLQRVDAASLLWRLHLLEVDVGDRWRQLAAGWHLAERDAGFYAFNDLHALLALVGIGDIARAEAWVRDVAERAEQRPGDNRAVTRDIGLPLMRGVLAFAQGRFDAAARTLHAVATDTQRFGGSHAQRDLIHQTLLAATLRGTDRALAHALLDQRRRAKPGTPLTAHWERRLSS